jgi:hypothetical protein
MAHSTRTVATGADGLGKPLPLWFTGLLFAVLLTATLYGLLAPGVYRVSDGVRETLPQTLRGQDVVTLLAAFALVWGAVKAQRGSLGGHIVWLAVCLYAAYTYLMYVVVPFNDMFLVYVAAIGLSGFGLLNGLVRIDARALGDAFDRSPRRAVAWFLIAVGTMFVALWLMQIVPALPGGVPDGLFVYDIPSTVHVLDLAVVLPLVIGTGILLLRAHPIAPVLAALVLVKMFTLGLALVSMNLFVAFSGADLNGGETVLWAAIALVSLAWLIIGARRMHPFRGHWLRPTVW